ncbi:hypothetical protein RSAG8_01240, partial [Rhizoctonia solani AG-8 WAC10335]
MISLILCDIPRDESFAERVMPAVHSVLTNRSTASW